MYQWRLAPGSLDRPGNNFWAVPWFRLWCVASDGTAPRVQLSHHILFAPLFLGYTFDPMRYIFPFFFSKGRCEKSRHARPDRQMQIEIAIPRADGTWTIPGKRCEAGLGRGQANLPVWSAKAEADARRPFFSSRELCSASATFRKEREGIMRQRDRKQCRESVFRVPPARQGINKDAGREWRVCRSWG